ncbi:MAG: aspartate kinase, partial [Bdellovibrionales bacterium]|nr:aspartate kinase [Bdellovibrionales bacterium]
YTDVKGVYSTDPRVCPHARLIDRVCHEEMLEMASLGAKVLHPRSVYFAMQYDIPLVVLSSFIDAEGTWIVKEEELMEKPVVSGISYRTDEAKITINKLKDATNSLDMIFKTLSEHDIFVDMITQTGVVDELTNVSFTLADDISSNALSILNELVPQLGAEGVSLDRDIAKVSIVGIGMKYHTGVASRMFSVLAKEGIRVEMISTSEIKLSVVIPRKYCEVAVRSLHQEFIEHEAGISVEK